MILLPATWEDTIRREGERAYPNECCGVLIGEIQGDHRLVKAIIPLHNTREQEEQYHRFKIEPEDVMRAEKEAPAQGCAVLGFYHSHPDHPARPSLYDRENALPFYSYIIVSVEGAKSVEVRSWRLTDDRKEFLEELCVAQNQKTILS